MIDVKNTRYRLRKTADEHDRLHKQAMYVLGRISTSREHLYEVHIRSRISEQKGVKATGTDLKLTVAEADRKWLKNDSVTGAGTLYAFICVDHLRVSVNPGDIWGPLRKRLNCIKKNPNDKPCVVWKKNKIPFP